jgi:hypothetical protein
MIGMKGWYSANQAAPQGGSYDARMSEPRLVAVDWSGRAGAEQRQTIWMAEAIEGELVRLEGGRTRTELVELLIAEAGRGRQRGRLRRRRLGAGHGRRGRRAAVTPP